MSFRDEEKALVRALDRNRVLDAQRELVDLVAALIAGRPVLQMMMADLVADRVPGAPGSAMFGRSPNVIARTRSRLVRELIAAARLLAAATPHDDDRLPFDRLAAAIERCLRRSRIGGSRFSRVGCERSIEDFNSIEEALMGFVGVMRDRGVTDLEFLIPGRPV